MGNKLNVLAYNASLQELALLFHSGNSYLDNFLRSEYALDKNIGKTFVFLSKQFFIFLNIFLPDSFSVFLMSMFVSLNR